MYNLNLPDVPHARLVLTTALVYANGNLHVGHMSEAILTCIFARYRRLCGQEVMFLGADDAHGTAIEIAAENNGVSPERYIAGVRKDHIQSYASFNISYDDYHSTHSTENERLVHTVYARLSAGGHLVERDVKQLFDLTKGRALEDRRVKGSCPECGAHDQYGDSCDCGATYDATALINPVSTLSGETPIAITAQHLFFELSKMQPAVEAWLKTGPLHPHMQAKVDEWLNDGLRDWCITRTGPYFGFGVPDREDLFFYVWVDAPLGYIAALDHHMQGDNALDVWNDSETEVIHVIGKDIINFHAVFWPAVLNAANLAQPDRIHTHGFVTIAGQKMSKSRGNFVLASDLAKCISPDAFRWAIASRLSAGVTDIDLDANAVAEKVNADLAGKIANIGVRLRPFISGIGGKLGKSLSDSTAYQSTLDKAASVLKAYEEINLAEAVRRIMDIADDINRDIATSAPWKITNDVARAQIVTDILARYRVLAALIQPITPDLAMRALAIFGEQHVSWPDLTNPPLGRHVMIPPRLFDRIDPLDLAVLSQKIVHLPTPETT